MGLSSFRQHFRTTTGMGPVQFQERLHLQEARQLMLNQSASAAAPAAAGARCFGSLAESPLIIWRCVALKR